MVFRCEEHEQKFKSGNKPDAYTCICTESWERSLDRAEWAEVRSTMEDFGPDVIGDRESLCSSTRGGGVRRGGHGLTDALGSDLAVVVN